MDTLTKAQIIWVETKDLQVPAGGDQTSLSLLRDHVAAILAEAPEGFSRRSAIPAENDEVDGGAVTACAAAAEAAPRAELDNLRMILWPSADGRTLDVTPVAPPGPWASADKESIQLVGRFVVDGATVSAFSRSVIAGETQPRFVSLVTGTGLPAGTAVYAPPETVAPPRNPAAARWGTRLAIAAVLIFGFACFWSVGVGSVSRAAYAAFAPTVTDQRPCPVDIDVIKPGFFAPLPQWLPAPANMSTATCLGDWRKAVDVALTSAERDWSKRLQQWLAGFSRSDDLLSFSLVIPMLLIMAAAVLLLAASGLGVVGRPLGLFVDNRKRMSLTRIQFAVWLVVLIGGLTSTALFNAGFWASDLTRVQAGLAQIAVAAKSDQSLATWSDNLSRLLDFVPQMDAALWALIGITAGTTAVSALLMNPARPDGSNSQGTAILPQRRTRVLTHGSVKEASLSDIVLGETEESDGVVDPNRVQTIAITGLLASIYVALIFEVGKGIGGITVVHAVTTGTQVFASMPPAGQTFLLLLLASHATLLTGKLIGAYKKPN
ncbi:hypothetical protein [Kaistia terrae]|uniref:ABC transmembrane type-1 domain-containing protein n=1 Tax=Kaistia terrae TaxID=537017 RepID=A0ABW0Q382_9HYPH|nr:hypothetical protein [Kaistia terrae]MCX5578926.1 hypothetical protein [Kaistia terrae]